MKYSETDLTCGTLKGDKTIVVKAKLGDHLGYLTLTGNNIKIYLTEDEFEGLHGIP
jgi:hypothetical protein